MQYRSHAVLALALLAIPALAWAPPWPVTYTLDSIPVSNCGESWKEGDPGEFARFSFHPTEVGDCAEGICSFAPVAGGVDLLGGRLELYCPWVGGISGAQVTIEDHCDIGCTRVLLYSDDTFIGEASNATTGATEVVGLDGWYSNRLIVASCGVTIAEITVWLIGSAVGETSWSAIRALYD